MVLVSISDYHAGDNSPLESFRSRFERYRGSRGRWEVAGCDDPSIQVLAAELIETCDLVVISPVLVTANPLSYSASRLVEVGAWFPRELSGLELRSCRNYHGGGTAGSDRPRDQVPVRIGAPSRGRSTQYIGPTRRTG